MLVHGFFVTLLLAAGLAAASGNRSDVVRRAKILWKAGISPCMLTKPTIEGNILFTGSCDGKFYALEKKTGKEIWSYDTRNDGSTGTLQADPLLHKNLVVAGTDSVCSATGGDYVYAFDQETGNVIWKLHASVASSSFADVDGFAETAGMIVFGTREGEWVSVDVSSGRVNWRFQTASPGPNCETKTFVVSDGVNVCLLAFDGTIHCLEARSGRELWKRTPTSVVTTGLLMQWDVLYYGSADDQIYSLKPSNGDVLGRLKLSATPVGNIAGSDSGTKGELDFAYATDKKNGAGVVFASDDELTSVLWSRTSGRIWTSREPVAWNGLVITGNCYGDIVAFRASNGAPQWKGHVDGCIKTISHDDSTLYLAMQEGTIYAYQPPARPHPTPSK